MVTATDASNFEARLDDEDPYVSDEDLPLDETSREFVDRLIDKVMAFMEVLVGHALYPYQQQLARRIIESIVIEDAEEITALFSRQCLDGDTVVFRRDGSAVRLRDHEDAWSTGIRPVKRYQFHGGAEIIATDNHPVWTPAGWRPAGLLRPGDEVAALCRWDKWGSGKGADLARLVGYLVTDGSDRPRQSLKFTNTRSAYLNEVAEISDRLFGVKAKWYAKGNGFDLLLTTPQGQPNPLRDTYRGLDFDHGFPRAVLGWSREEVGEFVNRSWSGDGCVRLKRGVPDLFLACGLDEVYARYWQSLLAKAGISSTVKREWMAKSTAPFYRLVLGTASDNVDAFFDLVGDVYGKEAASQAVRKARRRKQPRPQTWPCPGLSKHLYRDGYGGAPRGDCVRCGSPNPRKSSGIGKGGAARTRSTWTEGDGEVFTWRRVDAITPLGEREVFDVEYPGKGWFVGNGTKVHNSGKSETVCDTVATLMILLPRLARVFPELLGKFKNGLWVGVFAPVEGQAETLFGRIVDRLTSERALEIMSDPEIDDAPVGSSRQIRLKKSGSNALMMTANPRAKIESKSFHLAVVDEAQDCDDYVVRKSIHPMLTAYAGTIVKTGTPTTRKGDFFKAIQLNKRRQTGRGRRQNHFEADWRVAAKYNPSYLKAVRKEMLRMGEDSDEFQMSYNLKWLLERGMFTTSTAMDELGDVSMELVRAWHRTPVVVGIDPARKQDTTVVTVVWVDWDRPDEFGYFDHRILNWLEIIGDDWEEQYFQIVSFLANYNVLAVGVDSQGVGDAVAQRLKILLPGTEVIAMPSNTPDQSKRWKHLMALMQRRLVTWPAHAKTRRLKTWQRFRQQMLDAEKVFQGPNMLVRAPEEAAAHDDYPDSLAIACALTLDLTMPEVQVSNSPFF